MERSLITQIFVMAVAIVLISFILLFDLIEYVTFGIAALCRRTSDEIEKMLNQLDNYYH